MPQKSPNTVYILEEQAILYKRNGTTHRQVRYKADGKWLRASTKQEDLDVAKEEATRIVTRSWFRVKEGLSVVNNRFKTVAELAIKRMDKELADGYGKVVYKHYIQAINNYLIPYFGRVNIQNIDYMALQSFNKWRADKMRKSPTQSTLNTHTAALNRVFDEALQRGYITESQRPYLKIKGVASEKRPTFTKEEYNKLTRNLVTYIDNAREGNETYVRNMLRNYVLILANTGIRAGTEAMNLKWQHIDFDKVDGQESLKIFIKGKTKARTIWVRASVADRDLVRIKDLDNELKHMTLREIIKSKVDKYVLRLDGKDSQTKYGKMFGRFLRDIDLLADKYTNKSRTLYSLRHYYATDMLIKGEVTAYQLAKYMGTSEAMIQKHYGQETAKDLAPNFIGKHKIKETVDQ